MFQLLDNHLTKTLSSNNTKHNQDVNVVDQRVLVAELPDMCWVLSWGDGIINFSVTRIRWVPLIVVKILKRRGDGLICPYPAFVERERERECKMRGSNVSNIWSNLISNTGLLFIAVYSSAAFCILQRMHYPKHQTGIYLLNRDSQVVSEKRMNPLHKQMHPFYFQISSEVKPFYQASTVVVCCIQVPNPMMNDERQN